MTGTLRRLNGIAVEYRLADKVIVFSHGFGVQRDSRGMFTDIVNALPKDVGFVLFDYYDVQGRTVRLTTFSEQVKRLQTVMRWLQEEGVHDVGLVAHSMGCIVAALAHAKAEVVFLLAPPTTIGARSRAYFTGKEGATEHDGVWTVPRGDGTPSLIPDTFFDEFEATDAAEALRSYAMEQPYTLIAAGSDEVLKDVDYAVLSQQPGVAFEQITQAGHNFDPPVRQRLIERIVAAV
jgi:pimeloyl-ACP methyl ester carboxylesterase